MELKLRNYDLSGHIQKKPTFRKDPSSGKLIPTSKDQWLDYVEWSVIWEILINNYDEVDFWSETHSTYPNTLLIVLVLDSVTYRMSYPIINGNAVITQPTQMDYHKAELRGFVKAVAKYTGLGLSLWQKDEFKLDNEVKPKALLVTEKTVLSKNTIEELNKLWLGITPDSQTKLREVFSQRKTEIENGF